MHNFISMLLKTIIQKNKKNVTDENRTSQNPPDTTAFIYTSPRNKAGGQGTYEKSTACRNMPSGIRNHMSAASLYAGQGQ